MPLNDTYTVTHPGQQGAAGAVDALHIEEYTGIVEKTIARKSCLDGRIPMRTVKGTSTFTNFGVGESTLQRVTPGAAPDGTVNKFGKRSLSVDTLILARSVFPLLETFQTSYDARKEVGEEHGKKIAKFRDESFFIQAVKAAQLSTTTYAGLDAAAGHLGGSQVTLGASADAEDPALLYSALTDLFVSMEQKDVDPLTDDVIVGVSPAHYAVLEQNELLIDRNIILSDGNSIQARVLKARGVPVVASNNFVGGKTISGHLLSNADNANAYDGDFSKVVACAFSPRALMAGQTIPLSTLVFWSDTYKQWFVDAWLSYAVGPNRPEFAGVILRP